MPYFPVFQDLTGKKILVVGSGKIAKRKIRLLMDFTNNLTVITHDDFTVKAHDNLALIIPDDPEAITHDDLTVKNRDSLAVITPDDPEAITHDDLMVKDRDSLAVITPDESAPITRDGLRVTARGDPPVEKQNQNLSDANASETDKSHNECYKMPLTDQDFSEFINSGVEIKCRQYSDEDLIGVDFCIASTEDSQLNHHIAELCKIRGTAVNVPDAPELCSFYLPAVVRKGELVIAVSTGGKSPALSAKLRGQIEHELKSDIEEILDRMAELRTWVPKTVRDSKTRSKIYHCVLNEMMEGGLKPDENTVLERAMQIIDGIVSGC